MSVIKQQKNDVEYLPWQDATKTSTVVEEVSVMQDRLSVKEFPGETFVRFRFPGSRESPIIIVSYNEKSPKECVVHRVNKRRAKLAGKKGVEGLWRLTRKLLEQDYTRIWTGQHSERDSRKLETKKIKNRRQARRRMPLSRTERTSMKMELRKLAAWRLIVQGAGFSPRSRGDPNPPKILRQMSRRQKPMLLRRRA